MNDENVGLVGGIAFKGLTPRFVGHHLFEFFHNQYKPYFEGREKSFNTEIPLCKIINPLPSPRNYINLLFVNLFYQ